MQTRETLIQIYLDYFNNYGTYARYAECNGLDVVHAQALIDLARIVYNTPHPEA